MGGYGHRLSQKKISYIADDKKLVICTTNNIYKERQDQAGFDYVYSKENDWQLVKMDEEGFKSSNYEFGMGEYYKTGDPNKDISHFKLVQNEPWQEHDPGAGIQEYTLSVIRPLQQLKLGN